MNIISPGLLTTVQDLGRFGYMESGFSPCGAMDSFSARLAKTLYGLLLAVEAGEDYCNGYISRFKLNVHALSFFNGLCGSHGIRPMAFSAIVE